jgi:hypothetical protein
MTFLAELWLPILAAAVLVFLASSAIHVALPIHKGDHARLPDERCLGPLADAAPGSYVFPFAQSMDEVRTEPFQGKLDAGPVGFLTLMPRGSFGMGKSLALWFVQSLVVGTFVAYLASLALQPGAPYLQVFRVTGAAAFLGYGFAHVHDSMWKGAPWSITFKFMFDGLVYALVTAGTFAWLWPA